MIKKILNTVFVAMSSLTVCLKACPELGGWCRGVRTGSPGVGDGHALLDHPHPSTTLQVALLGSKLCKYPRVPFGCLVGIRRISAGMYSLL